MNFKMVHQNFNVLNLEKSLDFYDKALNLHEVKRITKENEFIIVYLESNDGSFQLELTWLNDRQEKYDLGEAEFHLAFVTDEYEKALKLHQEMGVVCFINEAMGIYFIEDPDGYWLEVLPSNR